MKRKDATFKVFTCHADHYENDVVARAKGVPGSQKKGTRSKLTPFWSIGGRQCKEAVEDDCKSRRLLEFNNRKKINKNKRIPRNGDENSKCVRARGKGESNFECGLLRFPRPYALDDDDEWFEKFGARRTRGIFFSWRGEGRSVPSGGAGK